MKSQSQYENEKDMHQIYSIVEGQCSLMQATDGKYSNLETIRMCARYTALKFATFEKLAIFMPSGGNLLDKSNIIFCNNKRVLVGMVSINSLKCEEKITMLSLITIEQYLLDL